MLISSNGKVEKGKWEYLGNNSLLIDRQDESYLFKHGFFDENVLALKIDGKEEYAFMINENKYDGELNSFDKITDFLNRKYINPQVQQVISRQPTDKVKIEDRIDVEQLPKKTMDKIFVMFFVVILVLFVFVYFKYVN